MAFLVDLKGRVLFERPFTDKLRLIVGSDVLPADQIGTVNVADVSNYPSSRIGWEWARRLPGYFHEKPIKPQTAGDRFTSEVRKFLERGITLCQDVRKTDWKYALEQRAGKKAENPRIKASEFAQYAHLNRIAETFAKRPDLEAVFGSDYIVEPDIVVFSRPFSVEDLGGRPKEHVATFSPLLNDAINGAAPILHASVSCKLTIRSDRAQNARLEALNLIRTRKGRVPNIAFVTAEPLPSRIASLALGTGDVDCIYHVALYELVEAVDAAIAFSADKLPADEAKQDPRMKLLTGSSEADEEPDTAAQEATPTRSGMERQRHRLNTMIDQGRLRDVSDLVLDLLI